MTQPIEASLEEVVEERQFAGALQTASEAFFRLGNTLLSRQGASWSKKHYFQLYNEADALESFLDDYGARLNRHYHFFAELVASLRGFAQIGCSITHLDSRLASYRVHERMPDDDFAELSESVAAARDFLRKGIADLFHAALSEASELGLEITPATFPEDGFAPLQARRRLPRNMDVKELTDERRKIAELVSKYMQACEMLGKLGIQRLGDPAERSKFLSEVCTEELARVYEATVHNLQSAYDTHIKNTVLEAEDKRLVQLRGHISAALHGLEAVTQLTHFVERHESDVRDLAARERLAGLVPREEVHRVILNLLLFWVGRFLQDGSSLADDVLPSYTNLQSLAVELDEGLVVHARPASMIVSIVNHYGTPVELELQGQTCNAASILELMVLIGSHPEARRFTFRGDEHPLRDIGTLFEHGLGQHGADSLPANLDYLRRP